jgi:SAM-dependent methyltransferase
MSFSPCDLTFPEEHPGPEIEWEEPNCLLCGNRRWTHLIEAPDNTPQSKNLWFAVVQCQDCGLCFTNPRPDGQTISQFYPASYRPRRAPRSSEGREGRPRPLRKWCRSRRERKILSRYGERRLLDFGCGGGAFLERMNRQGWHVTGVDIAAEAVEEIRTSLGLSALVGSLPHPELRPGSFDVITMWHSLEHVHQPCEVLQEAFDLLAPGGKLMVATPNIDSHPFRWFGPCWYGLDLPRHLTHFSPETLRWMLERAGFQLDAMHMMPQSSWIRSSAKLACQRGAPNRWQEWLRGKTASRVAAGYSYLAQQCDCIMATATRG